MNIFYFVDTSVTRSFTSALCLVTSGIRDLLYLWKCTRQHCMYRTVPLKCVDHKPLVNIISEVQQQHCGFIQASRNAVYVRLFVNMPVVPRKFTRYNHADNFVV